LGERAPETRWRRERRSRAGPRRGFPRRHASLCSGRGADETPPAAMESTTSESAPPPGERVHSVAGHRG